MKQLHPKSVWLFFAQYLLLFFFLIFFMIPWILTAGFSYYSNGTYLFLTTRFFGLIIWTTLSYVFAKWSYNTWKYELTDDAMKVEKGVIWKKYISIPYERIQNVDI